MATIEGMKATASVTYDVSEHDGSKGITVRVHYVGGDVDRRSGYGWGFRDTARNRALAARLCAAIEAGVVGSPAGILTDCGGATYVKSGGAFVLGRRMNADLRRLGF